MILIAGWGRLGRHLSYLTRPYHQRFLIWHTSQNRLVRVRSNRQQGVYSPPDLETCSSLSVASSTEVTNSSSQSKPLAQNDLYFTYGLQLENHWQNVDSWETLFLLLRRENFKIESIFLSLPDRLLKESIDSLIHAGFNGPVIHFSGAFYHTHAYDLHPLASLGYDLLPDSLYSSIYWVSSYPPPPLMREKLFPFIRPTQYVTLLPEQKNLYHALCVLAGPGAQVIWHRVVHEFETMGLPAKILIPYLHTLLPRLPNSQEEESKVASIKKVNALKLKITGPWTRQDQNTIAAHLSQLQPPLKELYSQLMTMTPILTTPIQKESL